MGLLNWIKGILCTAKIHKGEIRYDGMCVDGYRCVYCGYEWYEKKGRK